jgi:Pyruvate/2-oxoacid:ferredoxin oxidoreductase delta subunit
MWPIVDASTKIAVAHCPCRMSAKILGRTDCQHSLEVCIKYDEMAEFVISQGLARQISKDETLHILENCEKEGLVHMVDNAQGQIKHTCNCCGHYCWNVGIIRRRKIPRDILMAVYFIRETDDNECIGCGECTNICPVNAVEIVEDRARVNLDWCIGCGVCAVVCPSEAITIKRSLDEHAPKDFTELHQRIKQERDLV